ncbi:MAG: tetratricopeptide repeat protein [Phycisphaerales bacterium]|nr:tetratricopeptide repeat protein [Phycisphaerales bacterium]
MRTIVVVAALAAGLSAFIAWRAVERLSEPAGPAAITVPSAPATPPRIAASEQGEPERSSPVAQPEEIAAVAPVSSPAPALREVGRVIASPAAEVKWAREPEERRSDGRARVEQARAAFLRDPADGARLAEAVRAATEAEAWAELVDVLSRAVDAAPDNLERRFDLAAAQMRLRLWNLAIDQLQVVVAARPEDRRAAYNLAVALSAAGRLHEAREAWDRVVGLGADADTLARRAEVQMDLGNWHDAAVNLTAARGLDPGSAEIALNLATALERSSRFVEAEAILAEFIERQPQHVPAMMRLAQLIWRNYELRLPSAENVVDRGATAALLCGRILAVQPSHAEARALRERIVDAMAHWCPPRDMTDADLKRIRERIAELEKEARRGER